MFVTCKQGAMNYQCTSPWKGWSWVLNGRWGKTISQGAGVAKDDEESSNFSVSSWLRHFTPLENQGKSYFIDITVPAFDGVPCGLYDVAPEPRGPKAIVFDRESARDWDENVGINNIDWVSNFSFGGCCLLCCANVSVLCSYQGRTVLSGKCRRNNWAVRPTTKVSNN